MVEPVREKGSSENEELWFVDLVMFSFLLKSLLGLEQVDE